MPRKVAGGKPPSKVGGIADALERLESRRRSMPAQPKRQAPRRGDLDLDAIP